MAIQVIDITPKQQQNGNVHHDNINKHLIVVLLGWLGAQERHLEKYAQLYNNNNNASRITILLVTSPVALTALFHTPTLDDIAKSILEEIAKAMTTNNNKSNTKHKDAKEMPIIVAHAFSGGGCYLLERLEVMIANSIKTNKNNNNENNVDFDKQLDTTTIHDIVNSMQRGGIFHDSCPAYLHVTSGLAGIGTAIPNRGVINSVLRTLVQATFLLYVGTSWIVHYSLLLVDAWCSPSTKPRRQLRPQEHWQHVRQDPSWLWRRQGFIYSAEDGITDESMLCELIEYKRQHYPNVKLWVKRFKDSRHVLHYRKYPNEYAVVVDSMLNEILQ